MYDDLVKRLRAECTLPYATIQLMREATDAIDGLSKAYQMIAEAYESEVTKQKWIPVVERLPEEDGRYLTLYPLKTKPPVLRHKVCGFAKDLVEVDEYDFNEHKSGFYGYDGEYGYYEDKDVTHWMPLPEPPEEE